MRTNPLTPAEQALEEAEAALKAYTEASNDAVAYNIEDVMTNLNETRIKARKLKQEELRKSGWLIEGRTIPLRQVTAEYPSAEWSYDDTQQ